MGVRREEAAAAGARKAMVAARVCGAAIAKVFETGSSGAAAELGEARAGLVVLVLFSGEEKI
jgi:hypothetical protein